MGNKIVHVEFPVSDVEKMSKYYGDLFGWKFDKQAMPGMDYWMIATGQEELAGGMYKKMEESEKPRFYVEVEDIDGHTEKFKSAGGMVLVEKQEIPGMGWSVLGTDPEGNVVGLYQTIRQARPEPKKTTSKSSKKTTAKKSTSSKKKKSGGRK